MNIPGLKFTTNQAFDYIKQNWKPGKRELTFISIYLIIFIIGTVASSIQIPLAGADPIINMDGETVAPPPDYNLMANIDFAVSAVEFVFLLLVTFLYFKSSDKNASNGLKWGIVYAVPVTLINLASNIQYWATMPKDYISATYNPTLGIIGDVLYLPASFLLALLVAGGLYLFFVYRPNIVLTIISYISMVALLFVFGVAIRGTYILNSIYTYEVLFDVVGLSLMGLYFAVKNQITFKPFPQVFLFGGIILGISILSWISDIPLGGYTSEFVRLLSFIVFGFILYFILDKGILQTGATSTPPPPPPPPPPQ